MPKVSVIVPNYNHAPFLEKRIDSILGQTFQDFQLILLDDCSTDDSRSILSRYSCDHRVKIEFNETNSGNTFKQWNKGVGLAGGEYVWIAESDDYADERMLEKLVALLDSDPRSAFAYCRSWRVSTDGQLSGTVDSHLDLERWTADFWADGREECQNYLLRHNTIHNTSAVVFRREVFARVGGADESLTLCGDWKLWAAMALTGTIAYLAEPLNFYRLHGATVRAKSRRLGVGPLEYLEFVRWLLQQVTPTDAVRRKLSDDAFGLWTLEIDVLAQREPEVALHVIDEFLQLSGPQFVSRPVLANALLTVAGIQYMQGRLGNALVSAGRAFLARPIVAGRPVKKILQRLATPFVSRG